MTGLTTKMARSSSFDTTHAQRNRNCCNTSNNTHRYGRNLNFHRWVGFSGATALIFTAYTEYGNHYEPDRHYLTLANRIHFIHSLGLLAVPLARLSKISGILFLIGILFFCFGCYICGMFGINGYTFATWSGGVLLILAWMSFMF